MRSQFPISILVLASLFLASCRNDEKVPAEASTELSPEVRELCITSGNTASEALMKKLSTQLKSAMESGGPLAAVSVCQQVAQPLTEEIGSELPGMSISRTSLKVRNPENAPDELDRTTLESWQELGEKGMPLPDQELVSVDKATARFYKPIVTQELCVRCHGPSDSLDPELLVLLDQLYPEDKARGYKAGDLRGAFRVEIDLNSLGEPED